MVEKAMVWLAAFKDAKPVYLCRDDGWEVEVLVYQYVEEPPPIDMVLHCPACHMQHIDKPDTEEEYNKQLFESPWWELGGDKPERWTNPPHRTHLCRKQDGGCGNLWRPAHVATNGVPHLRPIPYTLQDKV